MQFFRDYFFHPLQVGHCAFALADPDDIVKGWNVAFLFNHARSQLETTDPDAGQMLGFHLRRSRIPQGMVVTKSYLWQQHVTDDKH